MEGGSAVANMGITLLFKSIDAHRDRLGEGPFWDQATGTLWTVDIANKLVRSRTPATGDSQEFRLPDLVSAAIPRAGGGLVVTLRDGVYLFDQETGSVTLLSQPDADHPDNRANEARVDPRGRLWLGTMQNNFTPEGKDRAIEVTSGTLSTVLADGTFKTQVTGIGISNTLCWSDTGDLLYFADTLTAMIWRYDVDPSTGNLGDRTLFAKIEEHGAPDGSALDQEGYLWNARWGGSCLIRFAPDGKIDRIVDVPVKQPTSCVFGGPDLRDLYVTSAANGLSHSDLEANPLEGATLVARAPVAGQPCTRFAG